MRDSETPVLVALSSDLPYNLNLIYTGSKL